MFLPFHNYIVSLFNMQNWKCEELANLKKIEPLLKVEFDLTKIL